MSESGEVQKVPFRIGFEGVVEPARIPSLIQTVSELATTQSIQVQFLDAEGDAISTDKILGLMFGESIADKGPTVSRDVFVATLKENGISSVMAGKSWGVLARKYNDFLKGRDDKAPVQFTGLTAPSKGDVTYSGMLYSDSLSAFVSRIETALGEHSSPTAISRMCGGDVGVATFETWKTFLENWQPDTSEAQ